MTNVDQFQSMFRSASREVFRCERLVIDSVLVIGAGLFGFQLLSLRPVTRSSVTRCTG